MPEFAQAFSRSRKLPGHFWTLGDKAALPAGTCEEETLDLLGCNSPLPAKVMRAELLTVDPATHRLVADGASTRPLPGSTTTALRAPDCLGGLLIDFSPYIAGCLNAVDAGTATSAIASRAACRASKRARATSPFRASTVTLLLRACLDTSGRPPTANYDLCRSVSRVLGGQGAHES